MITVPSAAPTAPASPADAPAFAHSVTHSPLPPHAGSSSSAERAAAAVVASLAPADAPTIDALLDLTAALVELLPSACLLLSPGGEIISLNRSAACLIDTAPPKPLRHRVDAHLDFGEASCPAALAAAGQQGWSGPVRVRDGANAGVRLDARLDALHGREGRLAGLIARLEPVSRSRAPDVDRIDPLTGLPCRHGIERRLAESVATAGEHDGAFVLFRIRMSGLAVVRGIHGRQAVDTVLSTVAGRLKSATRGTDLVGRFGDDEFVVAASIASPQDASIVTARIEHAMDAAIRLEHTTVSVRAGIGTALFPQDGRTVARLLARAAIVNKLFGV